MATEESGQALLKELVGFQGNLRVIYLALVYPQAIHLDEGLYIQASTGGFTQVYVTQKDKPSVDL